MITKSWIQKSLIVLLLISFFAVETVFSQSWTSLQGPIKHRKEKHISVGALGSVAYVCDSSKLFRTTNRGTSWSATQQEIFRPLAVTCRVDDPDVVIVGTQGYLYFNWYGGTGTWSAVLSNAGTPLTLSNQQVTYYSNYYMYMGRQASGSSTSIYRSTNGGSNWSVPVTYPSGTNIYSVCPYPVASIHDADVWAGGSDPSGASNEGGDPNSTTASVRGVWKSTDRGLNWTQSYMGNFNIRAVAIGDGSPVSIYAGTSTGKLYLSDEGVDWVVKSNYQTTSSATVINAICVRTDNQYVYVGSDQGVHRSTDGGNVWANAWPFADDKVITSLAAAKDTQRIIFATTSNHVYKTTNGGLNWIVADDSLGHMSVISATGSGSNYWAVWKDQDTVSRFYNSTWTNQEVSNLYSNRIMRDPNNGYLYLMGTINQYASIYRSTNDGQSYASAYTSGTSGSGYTFKGSMVSPQNSSYLYAWGQDGTTANFYNIANYGTGTREPYIVGPSASNTVNDVAVTGTQTIYYGLDNIGVYKSTAGPSSGNQVLSGVTIRSLAANPNVADNVYAAGPSGIKKTTNGGSSWTTITNMNLKRVVLCPGYTSTTNNILFLTNDGLHLYYSSNSGSNWADIVGTTLPTPIYDISAVPGNPAAIYVSTECGLYQMTSPTTAPTLSSPANGATVGVVPTLSWNSVSGISIYHLQIASDANFNSLVVDAPDLASTSYNATALNIGTYYWRVASKNYVGQSDYSSSRSFTTALGDSITLTVTSYLGGDGYFHPRLSWTSSGQGSNYYIYSYYCACYVGDCRSNDWLLPLMATTSSTTYDDAGTVLQTKGVDCASTIFYHVRSNGVSRRVGKNTAIGEEQKVAINEGIPKETKLKGNYPNPFNPVTRIAYDLKEDVLVRIIVYDILGREVQTLVNEIQSAGSKEIAFDGSHLPSGMYFYKFSAGKYHAVKKFILAK